ncbi:MAG TPA: DoxX family protein, partial [Dinghuibacter sp.]|uniref:DoxX family protein n=1 Tax=Dinghuibacter sp. TaxID=2024697 RepID=UPI002D0704E4
SDMKTAIPQLYLRLALGVGFLWLGLDRVGAWGPYGKPWVSWGDWEHFSARAHTLMGFLPYGLAEFLAVVATIVEIGGGFLLIIGLFTRWAAAVCSLTTFCFCVAMTITDGILSPIDYSVFTVSAACLLLATQPAYPWSVDAVRRKRAR